ncbi:MAG: hypothetical protein U0350_30390 [Caldilineaceae bacterium]
MQVGLDYAFLKYMDVSVDGEAGLHSFYLPLLAGRQRVLDLGCGMGGFVKLLRKHGPSCPHGGPDHCQYDCFLARLASRQGVRSVHYHRQDGQTFC